jgi:hypothetical protein
MATRTQIDRTIHGLLDQRGEGKTICPSEVARALGDENWRDLMDPVREAAFALADSGQLEVTQHGKAIDGRTAKGPIRLRRREK